MRIKFRHPGAGRDPRPFFTWKSQKWIPAFAGMTMLIVCSLFSPSLAHADKLKVVASFSILGDMVHQVAGDHVDLKVLVGPDSDAHVYEPTPADAKALASADLVVVNGLGFEGWLGRLIVASGYNGKVAVASAGVNALTLPGTIHEDPHAWQDLANARIYVTNIRDGLIAADKAHETEYRTNAANYLSMVDALNEVVKEEIAKVADNKRKVISSHDAFQYFARAYRVTFIAPQGLNTESAISAADIAQLIDQIRAQHVQALFIENISDSRLMKQLETDSGAHIGGTLYSDALSPANGPADTYLKLFAYNAAQLVQGMTYNQ